MQYDMHDYRRKPDPPTWSEWSPVYPLRYIANWILYIFVVPFLLGVVLTPGGILFTTIIIDYFQYIRAVSYTHLTLPTTSPV